MEEIIYSEGGGQRSGLVEGGTKRMEGCSVTNTKQETKMETVGRRSEQNIELLVLTAPELGGGVKVGEE